MKSNVGLELLKCLKCMCKAIVVVLVTTIHAHAVLPYPDHRQIEQALKRGRDFARQHQPPNQLYAHFGSIEKFQPQGFLVTKVSGLAVMSSHYALRGELPSEQDIQRVLGEEAMQVVVTVFGNSPAFAQGSYLLLEQDNQMIQPDRIRFDARARMVADDQGDPVYRAKIVGFFPYGAFEPESHAMLLVFPGLGGEIRFELDFSSIP